MSLKGHASRHAALAVRVAWLILPVSAAGLVHVAVLKADVLRTLAVPIDGGRRWQGRPLLGANKTWRGVLVMTAMTAVLTRLQASMGRRNHGRLLSVSLDYRASPWIAGGVMGVSYCLAELPNSFVKRQLGVPPGARSARVSLVQDAVDQTDSVIGCLIALRLCYRLRRGEPARAFILGSALHLGVDQLLYAIGVKRRQGYIDQFPTQGRHDQRPSSVAPSIAAARGSRRLSSP